MTLNRKVLARVGIAVFVALVLVFFGLALVAAWHKTNGEFPSIWRLVAAGVCWLFGLLAGSYAWATLVGGNRKVDHGAAVLISQLGKYVPGGVWQATGQLGLAKRVGVPLTRGAALFSVLAATQAVAGASCGLFLAVVWTDAAVWLRILLAVAAIVSLALLDRRWMVWALHKVPRLRDATDDLVPAQGPILVAYGMTLISLAATGGAFLLLLGSFGKVDEPWLVVAAYAAAWTVGFVAVPVPSGVGVREAVLVFILHGTFPTSVLVAASVYHRLVSLVTEGIVAAIASHRLRPSRLETLHDAGDLSEIETAVPPEPARPEGD